MQALEHATIIEYVTFEVHQDVKKETLIQAISETDTVLASTEGYIHRFLALQEKGTWTEVVFWRDKAAAEAGLQKFINAKEAQHLFSLINKDSITITYSLIQP